MVIKVIKNGLPVFVIFCTGSLLSCVSGVSLPPKDEGGALRIESVPSGADVFWASIDYDSRRDYLGVTPLNFDRDEGCCGLRCIIMRLSS